jgi:2-keto-4-pentenoate hydratase
MARTVASGVRRIFPYLVTHPTSVDHATVAKELWQAEASTHAIAPPSQTANGLGVDDAYRIQRINLLRRIAAGETRVGHKIGLTSLAIQKQLGVDQPDFGSLTDRMIIPNGGTIEVDVLIAPRVEAEFAFRIGKRLPKSPTRDELRDAIDGVAIALEVIDSRVVDWKITLVDTIADNASSARMVHGAFREATAALLDSLPASVIELKEGGEVRASGPGSAVMGDPIDSLLWLARSIGDFGDGFEAGDVVIAGAVDAAVPLTEGSLFTATCDGFEDVRLQALARE